MSSRLAPGEAPEPDSFQWRRVPSAGVRTGASSIGGSIDRAELDRLLADARRQGRAEGEQAAAQQAAKQVEQSLARIQESLQEIASIRQKLRLQMEQDLVHLAIVVARRILHRELTVDPSALQGVVKAALDRIDASEVLRLRATPADARFLEPRLAALGFPSRVEIAADPKLAPGSVIVETTRGTLDASLDTQLTEIERGFTDLVRRTQ
jgi:flagellar assembly protein FliH